MHNSFQDREKPLEEICAPVTHSPLLNVYGEAGIGKSRLLREATVCLGKSCHQPLVFKLDIGELEDSTDSKSRKADFLSALTDVSGYHLNLTGRTPEQNAGSLVAQLERLASRTSVYLLFDTTETMQNIDFWDWLQEHFVETLVLGARVKQVFAGRVPVPWRRFELRRTVKLLPLGPITPQEAVLALISETLKSSGSSPEVTAEDQEDFTHKIIELAYNFSYGHPGLSEAIAGYVATLPPGCLDLSYQDTLCQEVIEPFVNDYFFDSIDPFWKDILWWASVLDWFDPTILKMYLLKVEADLVANRPDYFFIQGISRMRSQNTVIWQAQEGDRLHGVIKDITEQCLKTMDPERYKRACLAAAETFEALAEELAEEPGYAQKISTIAERYRQRLHRLVSHRHAQASATEERKV